MVASSLSPTRRARIRLAGGVSKDHWPALFFVRESGTDGCRLRPENLAAVGLFAPAVHGLICGGKASPVALSCAASPEKIRSEEPEPKMASRALRSFALVAEAELRRLRRCGECFRTGLGRRDTFVGLMATSGQECREDHGHCPGGGTIDLALPKHCDSPCTRIVVT
jgi:hypothetical protein